MDMLRVVEELEGPLRYVDGFAQLTEGKRLEVIHVGLLALFGTIRLRAMQGQTSYLRHVGVFYRGTIKARSYCNPRTGAKGIERGAVHRLRFRPVRSMVLELLSRPVATPVAPPAEG